jgi:hypothetical protein
VLLKSSQLRRRPALMQIVTNDSSGSDLAVQDRLTHGLLSGVKRKKMIGTSALAHLTNAAIWPSFAPPSTGYEPEGDTMDRAVLRSSSLPNASTELPQSDKRKDRVLEMEKPAIML